MGSRAVGEWCDGVPGRARASVAVEGFEGFSSADALRANPCNASSGPVGPRQGGHHGHACGAGINCRVHVAELGKLN